MASAESDLVVRIRAILEVDKSGGEITKELKRQFKEAFDALKSEAAAAKSAVGAEKVTTAGTSTATTARAAVTDLYRQQRITETMFNDLTGMIDRQVKQLNSALAATAAGNKRVKFTPITQADYYKSAAQVNRGAARVTAPITESAVGDQEAPLFAKMLAAAEEQAAALQTLTARELGYAQALATGTAAQAEIDAQTAQLLSAYPGYAQSLATATAANAEIAAQQQQILAATPAYIQALATSTAAQASIKAQQQTLLAHYPGYAQSLATTATAQAQIAAQQKQILANTPAYIQALATSTAAQASINAAEQRLLVSYPGYAQSLASATISKAQIAAQEKHILSTNIAYITALTDSAVSQAAISADQKRQLSYNTYYITSLADAAVAQAAIAAAQKTRLASEQRYITAQVDSAVAQASINAQQKAQLAQSAIYVAHLANAAISQAQIDAAQKVHLASSTAYINALTASAISQAQINAQQKEQLAASAAYVAAQVRTSVAQAQIGAQTAEQLANNNAYIGAQVRQTTAKAALAANEQEILALTTTYASTLARSTASKAAIAASEQQILANNPLYASSLAASAIAKSQIAAEEARILAGSAAYAQSQADKTVQQNIGAKLEAEAALAMPGYITAVAEATAAKKLLAAAEERATLALLDDPLYQTGVGANKAKAGLNAANIRAQELASPDYQTAQNINASNKITADAAKLRASQTVAAASIEQESAASAFQKLQSEKTQILTNMHLLNATQQELAAKQQYLAGQNNLFALQKERIALEDRMTAAAAAGGVPPGRGANRTSARGGGGIDFIGGARSTIKYGLPSILLFGAVRGIAGAIKEAQELERIFNQIERQFKSFEEADLVQPGEFTQFQREIMAIARETGQAADEVAFVGFQLQGAFGGDTQKALRETRSAIQAVKVTGLELTEVIDAFTALTQNFAEADVSIEDVSDTALGLQERFGVLAKETISFAADLAPVGAAAGFTVDQLQALGAVAQKYSGRSGASLAEAMGRILPQVQENAADFVLFFESIPELAGAASDKLAAAFRQGDIKSALLEIALGYNQVSSAQQSVIADLLGGRREAAAIIPVLENVNELQREFAGETNDAGKSAAYFADLQETLAQQIARVGQELSQLGVALYNAGLKEFFSDLIGIIAGFVDLLTTAIDALQYLTNIGGGVGGNVLGTIVEALLLMKGASVAGRGITRLLGRRGATAAAAGQIPGQTSLFGTAATTATVGPIAAGTAAWKAASAAGTLTLSQGLRGFGTALLAGAKAVPWTATATAVALGYQQLSQALNRGVDEDIAKIVGPDGRSSRNEIAELLNEFGMSQDELDRLVADTFAEGGTWGDVEEVLTDRAREDASNFQQIQRGFNLGGDSTRNVRAARAVVDEMRARDQDMFAQAKESDAIMTELGKLLRERPNLIKVFGDPEGKSPYEIGRMVWQEAKANVAAGESGRDEEDIYDLRREAGAIVAQRIAREAERLEDFNFLASGEAQSLYEQGKLSYQQYINALRAEIAAQRSTNSGLPANTEDIEKLESDLAEVVNSNVNERIELLDRLDELRGGVSPDVSINRYIAALNSGDLTREGRADTANKIIDLLNELHQFQIDQTDSVAEQIRLYEQGIQIPEEVQTELLVQTLLTLDDDYSAFINQTFGGFTDLAMEVTYEIARRMIETGEDLRTASAAVLQVRLNIARVTAEAARMAASISLPTRGGGFFESEENSAQNAFTDAAQAQVDALESQLDAARNLPEVDFNIPTSTGADPQEATRLREQAAADAKRAAEEAARAAEEARRAQQELEEARLNYWLAQVENDPIQAAVGAQKRADLALRYASNEAARLNAQADRIRANRQLADAMYDIANSQVELLIAFADAAGDTVEAANLSLWLAAQELSQLRARGAGQAELNAAVANVATQEAAVRDAILSDKMEYYQYLHDMGDITTQQLIIYLESLKKIPELTEKQIMDLNRQIQGLKDELGQDFQFNLPSTLDLPTLYQARRLDQGGYASPIGSTGMVDNRVININFTANNTADAQMIAMQIVDQFSRPSRFGTAGRPY